MFETDRNKENTYVKNCNNRMKWIIDYYIFLFQKYYNNQSNL